MKFQSRWERLLHALRAAGLPQWPTGYQGQSEHRLVGRESAALTFGRTWKGEEGSGRPFVQEISENGTLAYRDTSTLLTAMVSVEGNELCQRNEAFLMGRKYFGSVYHNPDGTPAAEDEYFYVSAYGVCRFSVLP